MKYGEPLPVKAVCKLEVNKCKQLLNQMQGDARIKTEIIEMIKEAYYQVSKAFGLSRLQEAYIEDSLGKKGMDKFRNILHFRESPGERLGMEIVNQLRDGENV